MFGFNASDVRRVAWTFIQAFLAVFLVGATGALSAPNLEEGKAAVVAAAVAGVAAGISALKNLFLGDESTVK